MLSTLTLPAPNSSNTIKQIKNNAATWPSPKKSALCALNNAIPMQIINGIQASLVNKPSITKRLQKNSANITNAVVALEPIPIKFIMCAAVSLK